MMTVEVARRKICPVLGGRKCVAAECMMWRWEADEGGRLVEWLGKNMFIGYCGIAGHVLGPSHPIIAHPENTAATSKKARAS